MAEKELRLAEQKKAIEMYMAIKKIYRYYFLTIISLLAQKVII